MVVNSITKCLDQMLMQMPILMLTSIATQVLAGINSRLIILVIISSRLTKHNKRMVAVHPLLRKNPTKYNSKPALLVVKTFLQWEESVKIEQQMQPLVLKWRKEFNSLNNCLIAWSKSLTV